MSSGFSRVEHSDWPTPTQYLRRITSHDIEQNKSSMEKRENKSEESVDARELNIAAGCSSTSHNDNGMQKNSNILRHVSIFESLWNPKIPRKYQQEKRGSSIHGNIYQLKLLMLFLYRGVAKKYSFRLGTEIKQAGKFDDLVFEYTQEKKKAYRLLQAKHKLDESKTITADNLLGSTNGDYSLIKYFLSYEECKKKKLFEGGTIEDAIVCTNVDFDFSSLESAQIKVQKVETGDDILDVKSMSKEPARYKFTVDVAPLIKKQLGSTTHSLEEIQEFLDRLVFAVNQPNEDELGAIIKEEIGEKFDFANTENTYNKLLVEMLDWLQGKQGGRFLSSEEGEEFFEEARRGIPILFNVKTPVSSFTGRTKELDALHKMLQSDESETPPIVCICGLGGVGKSELAKKYISLYRDKYGKKIVWINAESYESLAASFRRLASDKLNISMETVNHQEKEIRSIVEEVYLFFTKQRSLFVFDNAEEYKNEKGNGLVEFLHTLPSAGKALHVLITTRNKNWPKPLKQLYLNVFNESEAIDFLKNSLEVRSDTGMSEIKKLTAMLDFMPLALQQAVSYINVRNEKMRNLELEFTMEDYINAYEEKTKEYLEFDFSQHSDGSYTRTVFTTWNVTLEMMRQMEDGRNALDILNIASYMAAEDIPTQLFSALLTDLDQLASAISLLSQYSLIKLENDKFNIHRLVQQVIRVNLQERNEEPQILRRALELLTRTDMTADVVSHALCVWNHSQKYTDLVIEFHKLSCSISYQLLDSNRLRETYLFGKNILKRFHNLLKEDSEVCDTVVQVHLVLVTVLMVHLDYDRALKHLQRILSVCLERRSEFGILCSRTAMLKIANVMFLQEKYSEALQYYEKVSKSENTDQHHQRLTFYARYGIAKVLLEQGEVVQASQILKDLWSMQEKTFGKSDEQTIQTQMFFAVSLIRQNKLDEALKILLEAHEISITFGNNSYSDCIMMQIASICAMKNDYSGFIQWWNAAIETQKSLYGENHPVIHFSRSLLANSLTLGNYKEASEDARAIFENLFEASYRKF